MSPLASSSYFSLESVSLVKIHITKETLQELRMLSSVTIDCQETKIVINPGSQLSDLESVSQISQVSRIVFVDVFEL